MEQLQQNKINTLDKGMITDTSILNQPEGTYRYALNTVNESISGDILLLNSEPSNYSCVVFPYENTRVLGSIYISYLNFFVLFITDGVESEIGKFFADSCTYETILKTECLNFNSCSYIEGTYTTLTNCNDIVIYWTDNINPVRFLNISSLEETEEFNCDTLNLFDCFNNPSIRLLGVNNAGGNTKTGTYYFTIRYSDNSGNSTNWLGVSNPIIIYDDYRGGSYSTIDGCDSGQPSTKSIVLELRELDQNYTNYELAVIYQENESYFPTYLGSFAINGSKDIYYYTGNIQGTSSISIDSIITSLIQYTKAMTMIQYDNALYLGNLKGYKNINYQKYANDIVVDYLTYTVPIYGQSKLGYKDPETIYSYKSWMRDEVYSLGIVWEFCDGTYSPVFHIPGREKDCFDSTLNLAGIPSSTDLEGNPLCDDFILEEDVNTIDCENNKWKNRNTAIRTHYSGCTELIEEGDLNPGELISYNILIISGTSFSVYTTVGNNQLEALGFVLTTEAEDYWFWVIDLTSMTELEVTTLLGELIILLPTFPYPEGGGPGEESCITTNKVPCIYSRGKMAYHETCERYPVIKDCNGDYMYPVEEDEEGSIIGQYIRHHRMPDSTIEPHYSLGPFYPIEQYNNGWVESSESTTNRKPYYLTYVHPLGIDVKNIKYPDDIEPGLVKGFKIVYVPRTEENKTVIAKGILHNCMLGIDENNRKSLIPKHAVNSYEYYNYPSISGTHSALSADNLIQAYTFFSPNTAFNKPGLNADHIKIEWEFYGRGDVYGDEDEWDNDELFCEDGKNRGRRQNYNINQKIYSRNNDKFQINRKLKGANYLGANQYIDDTGAISLPVDNRFRESSVCLELLDINPADGLKLINYWNDYEGGPSPYLGNVPIRDADTSFWKNSNLNDVQDRARELGSAATWYVSLKRNICNINTNLSNLYYIDTGLRKTTPEADDIYSIFGAFGDSYINYWSYRRTSRIGNSDNDDGDYSGVNFKPRTLKTLIHSVVESDFNVDLRQEGATSQEIYYPKLNNNVIALDSAVPNEARPYNAYLNQFYYNTCTEEVENFSDNYFKLNKDFVSLNNIRRYYAFPNSYNTCDCTKDFSTNIAISNYQDTESGIIGFKKFAIDNSILLPKNTGPITGLYVYNNIIYAHTLDSTWKIFISNQQLQTDENTVYLGTAGIKTQTPMQMYATNEGYGGCQQTSEHITNQYGHFWIDRKGKKIFRQTEGFQEISNEGLNKWFYNNMNLCSIDCDSTNSSNKFVLGFDHLFRRFLLTKVNKCGYDNNIPGDNCDDSWTISYSLLNEKWSSFHSYIPENYLYTRDRLFTIKSDKAWVHNEMKTSYQTFYNIYQPFIVEFVQNQNPFDINVTNNIKIATNVTYYDIASETFVNNTNITFNRIIIYNTSGQCSGQLWVQPVNKNSPQAMNNAITNAVATTKAFNNEGIWQINEFSDLVYIYNSPLFMSGCLFTNPSVDKNINNNVINYQKQWSERQPFRGSNLITRLYFSTDHNYRMSFMYYLTELTKSIK